MRRMRATRGGCGRHEENAGDTRMRATRECGRHEEDAGDTRRIRAVRADGAPSLEDTLPFIVENSRVKFYASTVLA